VRILLEDKIGIDTEWFPVPEAYRLIIPHEKGGRLDATMPFGEEEYLAKMEEYVPGSRESVYKFIRLCEEVVDAFTYWVNPGATPTRKFLPASMATFSRRPLTRSKDVLDALKMPYRAQKIITAYWCYLGVGVKDLSFSIFAAMFYRYITSRPSSPLPLPRIYHGAGHEDPRTGRDILYNTRVEKILVEDGRVVGVETSHGDRIQDQSCHRQHLSSHRLQPAHPPPDGRAGNCLENLQRQKGWFLRLCRIPGLDKSPQELGLNEYSYFIYSTPDTNDIYDAFHRLERPIGQATVCLNNAVPTAHRKGRASSI